MKNHLLLIITLLTFTYCINAQPFEGQYYGEMQIQGEWQYIRLTSTDDKLLFRLPYEDGATEYELQDLIHSGTKTSFHINRFDEQLSFEGNWENPQKLSGKMKLRGFYGDFVLHQKQLLKEEDRPPYLGTYRLPSGLVLNVREQFNSLQLHSPLSQKVSTLRYQRDDQFFTATGEKLHFSNLKEGHFQQLEWGDREGNTLIAERFDAYRTRDITIITRKDTIAGTLFIPNTKLKHPACLITPGAGRLDRTNNFIEAETFASYGIATLVVDKPGTGQSTGDIWENSFIDKKDLAIDLYRWMQEQPEIDKHKIGLWGASQGSRIAIMAASELEEVAFLILAAHPIETMMNVQLYAIEQHLRGQFYPEVIISQATDVWRRFYHQVSEEKIDTNLLVEARALQAVYPEIYIPTLPDTRLPASPLPGDIYSDPVEYLATVKCPVLSINGELDERVPVQITVRRLEEALQKNGHSDYTKVWLPGANHSFILPGYRIAPGLFMKQVNWMKRRLNL